MSVPPPDRWGPQPGPPGFGQPGPGQPYQGQPPQGYQQPWYPPPGPPNKGSSAKWLIAGALVAVIVVAVAVIVVVLHSNSSGSSGSTKSPSASGIASANDNGPVTVITEDPSCAAWAPVINTLTDRTKQIGWDKRDASIPATAWTPEQRTRYQEATTAMLHAADQTIPLAKLTPHRVMRELYEQLIAYWHAYSDRISNYTPADEKLAQVAIIASLTVTPICDAITHGSAGARAPLVAAPKPPTQTPSLGNPANPERFLSSTNPVCEDWHAQSDAFNTATAEWQKTDGNIPVSHWSANEKVLNDAFAPVMTAYDEKFEQLGRRSGNATLEDLAVLSAQYGDAFVKSFPTYVGSDQYLYAVAIHSTDVVGAACKAVGS